MGIYDTMIYLITFVPTDTCIPTKISKHLSLAYTPNINDILYSASIWSCARLMYHPNCYICNKKGKDKNTNNTNKFDITINPDVDGVYNKALINSTWVQK